ncbi:TonB-dependent receptor [soil metagenome]
MLKILSALLFSALIVSNIHAQENDSSAYKTETINVDALRAVDRLTPVTFQDIDRKEIVKKNWMQDLPMFLNGNTSINAYSESGASIGYSYFSLRGFDQRRISILVNGIPQNDPEDHQVYWVDLSDITSSVQNIQIQRGIGNSLYGSSSIGGVVNLQTIDYAKEKFLNASYGAGDFNTRRYSLEYSSGLVRDEYGFYAKFTKSNSDGYREQSWSDHLSYFIGAVKLFRNASLKLNIYSSPIQNHLAYIGVTKDYLDGNITGSKDTDRRFNPLTYRDETDNYSQPHYEAIFNLQINKNLYLSNTVNYIRGQGYFITSFPAYYGYDFSYFHLAPYFVSDTTTFNAAYYRRNPDGTFYFVPGSGYQIDRSSIYTRLYVNNDTYGWFPKIQWTHNKGKLVVGGELKFHRSEHYGEIASGEALPQGTPPNFQYYYYNGRKKTISLFANELYSFNKDLTGMLGVQYASHSYSILNDRFDPYTFDVSYDFVTPRAGLNYNVNDQFSMFGNISFARQEPRLKDIYDAETPGAVPNFRIVDAPNNRYEDPLVKPEEMTDYELGFAYRSHVLTSNLNFYRMDFKNEIVSNGQIDNVGQPISGNAGRSVHQGIEFDLIFNPFFKNKDLKGLQLSGNLNFSDNYFKDYTEKLGADKKGNLIYGKDYSDNKILLNPSAIGNLSLSYQAIDALNFYIGLQYIGKQYIDNSENERKDPSMREVPGYVDKVIEPYSVVNSGISFDPLKAFGRKGLFRSVRSFRIDLKINNIFNEYYTPTGNVDYTGTSNWIPAALRNFYMSVSLGL